MKKIIFVLSFISLGVTISLIEQAPVNALNYDSDGLVVSEDIGPQRPKSDKNVSMSTLEAIVYSVTFLIVGAGIGYLTSSYSKSTKKSTKNQSKL